MPRKIRHEDRENVDRWLVSYADFITLLFTFFVMMYAISSVNTGRFRVLSNAVVATFEHKKEIRRKPIIVPKDKTVNPGTAVPQVQSALFRTIQLLVQKASRRGDMRVVPTNEGILLRIQSRVLFAPGHARIRPEAVPVLKKIARILARSDHEIRVRGYTDNQPIRTARYPNNWALSTLRAVNVLTRLVRLGPVEPERIEAVGFGKYRPIVSNLTSRGREANRRVEIMILNRVYVPKKPIMIPSSPAGNIPKPPHPVRHLSDTPRI